MDKRGAIVFRDGRGMGRRRRPAPSWAKWVAPSVLGVALALGVALTGPGEALALAVWRFLEFYTGVFALVALSLTVMGGFVSTDRMVLLPRHRVSLQTAHRLTAILAVTCLAIHLTLKIAEAHVSVVGALVPFMAPHRRLLVGLGTIAFYLMALLTWMGITRARFANSSRPWIWRTVHVAAYPAWLFSIVHGLASGRHAATWVTVSYVLCVVGVSLGVLVRVGAARGRRGAGHTTGSIRAVPATPVTLPAQPVMAIPAHVAPPARAPSRGARVPVTGRYPVVSAPTPGVRGGAAGRRQTEVLSDDEFWSHMKGDAVR